MPASESVTLCRFGLFEDIKLGRQNDGEGRWEGSQRNRALRTEQSLHCATKPDGLDSNWFQNLALAIGLLLSSPERGATITAQGEVSGGAANEALGFDHDRGSSVE